MIPILDRATVTADGDNYLVRTSLTNVSALRERLSGRVVPGGWRTSCTQVSTELLKRMVEDWTDEAALLAEQQREAATRAYDARQRTTNIPGLYRHQHPAVAWLREIGRGLLAFPPGAGKTRILLHAIDWEAGPALVITPRGVVRHWLREAAEIFPYRQHAMLLGTPAKRAKDYRAWLALPDHERGICVIGWGTLSRDTRLASYGSTALAPSEREPGYLNDVPLGTLVVDEAHRALNPPAKQTRAAWWLADRAARVYAATGTPVESSPLDVWSMCRLVAAEDWPSRVRYIDTWCKVELSWAGYMESVSVQPETEALWRTLTGYRIMAADKETLMPWLPDKTYATIDVELPPALRRQYVEMSQTMQTGDVLATDPLVQYIRLVQASLGKLSVTDQVINEDGTVTDVVRVDGPSPTVIAFMETWEDHGKPPAMVAVASRQLQRMLCEALDAAKVRYVNIAGGMSGDDITEAVDAYNDGRADLLVLQVAAAAEGLSLKRGSHEYFLDRHPRRVINLQAEDRMHGVGRGDGDRPLLITDFVVTDTVQERVRARLADKADTAEFLVHPSDFKEL